MEIYYLFFKIISTTDFRKQQSNCVFSASATWIAELLFFFAFFFCCVVVAVHQCRRSVCQLFSFHCRKGDASLLCACLGRPTFVYLKCSQGATLIENKKKKIVPGRLSCQPDLIGSVRLHYQNHGFIDTGRRCSERSPPVRDCGFHGCST